MLDPGKVSKLFEARPGQSKALVTNGSCSQCSLIKVGGCLQENVPMNLSLLFQDLLSYFNM